MVDFFVPLNSILESITICTVLCGGLVKEAPSVSFCRAIFFFFQKEERDKLQPEELYNGTVERI